MGLKARLLAGALALGVMAGGVANAAELVVNGGFETGNLAGWSVGVTPGASVCCYGYTGDGSRVSPNAGAFSGAIAGAYSLYGDWDGGDGTSPLDYNQATDFFVRQLLTKASDVTSATLTFSFNV